MRVTTRGLSSEGVVHGMVVSVVRTAKIACLLLHVSASTIVSRRTGPWVTHSC